MTGRVDFLDTDPAVAGQQFCCISFVSPNSIVEEKEKFVVREFLRSELEKLNLSEPVDSVLERFDGFKFREEARLQEDFQKKYPAQSTVQGLKIRGSYETLEQAKARAAYLQRIDPDFHVFVGQVGYWLPWNPRGDHLQEEVFLEEELNQLIGKYKENVKKTEEFYRAETQRRLDQARLEGQAGRKAAEATDGGASSSSALATASEVLEALAGSSEPAARAD